MNPGDGVQPLPVSLTQPLNDLYRGDEKKPAVRLARVEVVPHYQGVAQVINTKPDFFKIIICNL